MTNEAIKGRCLKCNTVQDLGGGLCAKSVGKLFTMQFCVTCKSKQWCEVVDSYNSDKSQTKSPKRIVLVEDGKETVVWESQPTNAARGSASSSSSVGSRTADSGATTVWGQRGAK